MEKGTKILLGVAIVLVVVLIVLKVKQRQTPELTLGDLFTQVKTQLGI